MGVSSWIATWLDWEFLEVQQKATIWPPLLPDGSLPPTRSGTVVADELGGRKLLHYLSPTQHGTFCNGSDRPVYVTPTPYAPEEASHWLVLPSPWIPRQHLLILDPSKIPLIQGPLWVAAGRGIQYVLPQGFPADAILVPGAPGAQWEIEVR